MPMPKTWDDVPQPYRHVLSVMHADCKLNPFRAVYACQKAKVSLVWFYQMCKEIGAGWIKQSAEDGKFSFGRLAVKHFKGGKKK